MAEAFPGSSVLVVNGTGHTSVFANTNFNCARTYILPYFLDGVLPESGTVCEAEQEPFQLVGEVPLPAAPTNVA